MRVVGVIRRYPLTGGAEALTGHRRERAGGCWRGPEGKNTEVSDAGCAKKNLALRVDFVSGITGNLVPRSLTLIITEEICGRFGSFDGSIPAYRALRVSAR